LEWLEEEMKLLKVGTQDECQEGWRLKLDCECRSQYTPAAQLRYLEKV